MNKNYLRFSFWLNMRLISKRTRFSGLYLRVLFVSHQLSTNCVPLFFGSTTTDRDKLTANQLTANQLTANNADWLRTAILNKFLLSPEPSCPNPHFVTKWLRRNQWRNHVTKSLLRGQLTWLVFFVRREYYRLFYSSLFRVKLRIFLCLFYWHLEQCSTVLCLNSLICVFQLTCWLVLKIFQSQTLLNFSMYIFWLLFDTERAIKKSFQKSHPKKRICRRLYLLLCNLFEVELWISKCNSKLK